MALIKLASSVTCAVLLASYSLAAPAGVSSLVASSSVASAFTPVTSIAVPSSSVISSASASPSSLLVSSLDTAAHSPSFSSSAPAATETVPYASENPNPVMWGPDWDGKPKPLRGSLGTTNIMGPQNVPMDLQNPDLLAPPTTDAGTVYVSTECTPGFH